MSIALLLQPELSKFADIIHTNAHAAFGHGSGRNFPLGEVLHEEFEFGMLVHSVIEYHDRSQLIYFRDPEHDHGHYAAEPFAGAGCC